MKCRFGILSREAAGPDEMVWLECDGPGHIWHTVSAWEEIGEKVFYIFLFPYLLVATPALVVMMVYYISRTHFSQILRFMPLSIESESKRCSF